MLGRPMIWCPVFMNIWAGAWLNCVARIDFTMAISSTTSVKCGSRCDTSAPDWPCFWNLAKLPSRLGTPRMNAKRSPLMSDSGMGLPSSSFSFRL